MSSNFLNPVTTQTWANGRHLVRCVKVIQETWDVRTFCCWAAAAKSEFPARRRAKFNG